MKKYVLLGVVLMLAGCATVQPISQSSVRSESKHVFDKSYVVGAAKSVYVGESMIRVKDYYALASSVDALASTEAFTMKIPPFATINGPANTPARVVGTTERGGATYRVVTLSFEPTALLRFLLKDDGSLEGSAINWMGERMGWTYSPEPASVRFVAKTLTQVDTSKGSKNFEIVYSGTTKDSLNLLYREYTPEDLARPAFTQNLTYANGSKSIRFRDIQIEVEKADNQGITYTVVQDGMQNN